MEIKNNLKNEDENIKEISEKYMEFINKLNNEKKSSSKNYYIIIKYEEKNNDYNEVESLAKDNLNNNYFKLKDALSRCGNYVEEISTKSELNEILFSFFNNRIYFNKK